MSHLHTLSAASTNFSGIQEDQTLVQVWLSDSLRQALRKRQMHKQWLQKIQFNW